MSTLSRAAWCGLVVFSSCTAVRPSRAAPLLECAAALAEPARQPEVAWAMAEAGARTRAWDLLKAADPKLSWPLEAVARAAAEAGDVALVEAVNRATAHEWGTSSNDALRVRRAASLGYLAAGSHSRAWREAEAAGKLAPWLAGAVLLRARGEPRRSREWLVRAFSALDEWSVLPVAELARELGASELARLALRRTPLPRRDARVVAATFLVGDAARAREELGGSLSALSTAVRALAQAGMTAELDALLAGQPAFERAQALALARLGGADARWGDAAAAAQQVEEPHTRAWAWVTLAEARHRTDPQQAEGWMRLAEQSAAGIPHEDDRSELLVEGWARAGGCARAVELAAGRPRLLLVAVAWCAEASHLDLLEQARDGLVGHARDEVTAGLVETAVRHGQLTRATRLAAALRPPLLVQALVALALGHAGASPEQFPSCAAPEP